jgi:hypothetical protein
VIVGWVTVVELGPWVVTVAPGPAEELVVVVVCGPEVVVVDVVADTSGWPDPSERLSAMISQQTDTVGRRCCLRQAPFENRCFCGISSAELGARGMM